MSASSLSKRVSSCGCIVLTTALTAAPLIAQATDLNAGAVMQKMGVEERYAFVAGIVEGLAISRFLQDGKKPEGMNCIYDWFYKNPKTIENIYAAFGQFPTYPPGSVVNVMVRKACS